MKSLLEFLARRGTLVDAGAARRLSAGDLDLAALEADLRAAPALPLFLTETELSKLARVRPAAPRDPSAPVAPQVTAAQVASPAPQMVAALQAPAAVALAPPVTPAAPAPAPVPVHHEWVAGPVPAPKPPAEPVTPYTHQWEVMADVTGQSTCDGSITDFTRYFNDRMAKIKKMLRARREMVGTIPIKSIRAGAMAEVKIVGIVNEVRNTKNGHRLLEIEDESGVCAVLAPASDPMKITESESVIEDEVIGVIAKPASKGDLLILERIIRPEVPMERVPGRSVQKGAVAFLSDLHFGSKTWLADDWERFIRWINLDWPEPRGKALARKVRYLVVNGDVVDGIGIFPGQEDELAIVDAFAQYRFAGEQLARVREDVKIFVMPGNHDLVRPAEPQPAFHEKYARLFPGRVTFLGNPCKLHLEGVEVLAYHGRSFDDWITRVAGLSYERPLDAMREMVTRRHMVPIYGARTPIAPEHKDFLVIDTVPDVFATGHVHAAGLETWKGITLINSSCWQSQTAYQKMHGFQPQPGKVPVVELDNGRSHMMDFHDGRPAGVDLVGYSKLGKTDPWAKPEF